MEAATATLEKPQQQPDDNGLYPGGQRAMQDGDSSMSVLGRKGDTKLIWDKNNADEVEAARATFTKLIGKGFAAFKAVGKDGKQGEQIRTFDPAAERIIIIPQMAGG